MLKTAGYIRISDPSSDTPNFEADTLQCVHCGGHFPVKPGSGKLRGMCRNCNGPVCGPQCAECIPVERYLGWLEGTDDLTSVSVGGNLWLG